MTKASDDFKDVLIDFLCAVSAISGANDVQTLGQAVRMAPPANPVHALSLRSYRCDGCQRLGLIRDVVLNFSTGNAECPECAGANLQLVQEGRA